MGNLKCLDNYVFSFWQTCVALLTASFEGSYIPVFSVDIFIIFLVSSVGPVAQTV